MHAGKTKACFLHMTKCSSEKWRALQRGQLHSGTVCSRLFLPTCFLLLNLWADLWCEVAELSQVFKKVLKNRKSLFASSLLSINRVITEQQISLRSQNRSGFWKCVNFLWPFLKKKKRILTQVAVLSLLFKSVWAFLNAGNACSLWWCGKTVLYRLQKPTGDVLQTTGWWSEPFCWLTLLKQRFHVARSSFIWCFRDREGILARVHVCTCVPATLNFWVTIKHFHTL